MTPARLQRNLNAVPVELRERPQWVVWKLELRDGKRAKLPYQVSDGGRTRAAANDPGTWATFEQAVQVSGVHGVGYVFAPDDPYCGIDLDACIDTQTGELHSVAAEILTVLGGYQERSPSGEGMHAIIAGKLGGDRNRTGKTPWGGNFEVYDKTRFFTVTGAGAGVIEDRQAQLDALVLRMFGAASSNGAAPSKRAPATSADAGAARSIAQLLDLFPDVAKLVARTGRKRGDGSASSWDFALGCRAAEHECSDAEMAALIRQARRRHGEDKGERDDYIERTVAAVRRQVGHPAREPDELLAQLTTELDAGQVDLAVIDIQASGHGESARVTFTFSDGSLADFSRAEHIANGSKLGATLATTIGIAAEFSPLQARRVAAHVRRYLGRSNAGREQELAATWGIDFLRLAQSRAYTHADQVSRFQAWSQLAAHDPTLADESATRPTVHGPDAYARSAIVARDTATGNCFVRAGWFQEYVRRTGSNATPHDVARLMEHVGWERPNQQSRIKATDPVTKRTVNVAFYIVPPGWETDQEADE